MSIFRFARNVTTLLMTAIACVRIAVKSITVIAVSAMIRQQADKHESMEVTKDLYDNNTYNLMRQMMQEHKMLWQIKNNYKSDASFCSECREFWEGIEKEGEQRVAKLEALLKRHMI
jgi:hypothetical protein